ncbi:MAG: hypothetical protein ACE5OZ_11980 [Candidatus Heimdallarchaeota archaeon]
MKPNRMNVFAIFLSIVLAFLTFPTATEGGSTVVELQQVDENKISLFKPVVSLRRNNKWINLETLNGDEETPTLRNDDKIRFEATIANQNKTEIELRTFSALIYNFRDEIAQSFVKSYKFGTPVAVKLAQNTTKTEITEGILSVEIKEPDFGEEGEVGLEEGNLEELREKFKEEGTIFKIQIRFSYVISGADETIKSSNMTFEVPQRESAPPEIVLWLWGGITSLLFLVVLVGIYGKLQLRKIEGEQASR